MPGQFFGKALAKKKKEGSLRKQWDVGREEEIETCPGSVGREEVAEDLTAVALDIQVLQ